MIRVALAFLTFVAIADLSGCWRSLNMSPTIEIDDAFTADQRVAIEKGMLEWAPAITPTFHVTTHAALLAELNKPRDRVLNIRTTSDANVILVYAAPGLIEGGSSFCPGVTTPVALPPGDRLEGVTQESYNGGITCLDPNIETLERLATDAAHELGHQYGLQHTNLPHALMNPSATAEAPTCDDWKQLAGNQGTKLPVGWEGCD